MGHSETFQCARDVALILDHVGVDEGGSVDVDNVMRVGVRLSPVLPQPNCGSRLLGAVAEDLLRYLKSDHSQSWFSQVKCRQRKKEKIVEDFN